MCTGSHNYTEFAYHLLPVALDIHCVATMSPATYNSSYKLYTDIPAERKKMHLKARGVHLRITHKSNSKLFAYKEVLTIIKLEF